MEIYEGQDKRTPHTLTWLRLWTTSIKHLTQGKLGNVHESTHKRIYPLHSTHFVVSTAFVLNEVIDAADLGPFILNACERQICDFMIDDSSIDYGLQCTQCNHSHLIMKTRPRAFLMALFQLEFESQKRCTRDVSSIICSSLIWGLSYLLTIFRKCFTDFYLIRSTCRNEKKLIFGTHFLILLL